MEVFGVSRFVRERNHTAMATSVLTASESVSSLSGIEAEPNREGEPLLSKRIAQKNQGMSYSYLRYYLLGV